MAEQEKATRSMANGTSGTTNGHRPATPLKETAEADDFVRRWEAYTLGKLVFVSSTVRTLHAGPVASAQEFGSAMFQATDAVRELLRTLYASATKQAPAGTSPAAPATPPPRRT